MSEPTELRQLVATEHGLPEESASFLAGATVEEIEESATAFEKLLEERREQESATSFLASVAAANAARQGALVNLLTGRAPQRPRDERGRFAAGGFDGGARPGLARTPESHDEMLIRILRSREADHGAVGFGR
jgi:hypothetical protein